MNKSQRKKPPAVARAGSRKNFVISAKRKIPRFRTEDEEREFWAKNDSANLVDWRKARRVAFPNLEPSVRTISLRLPESMLEKLRRLAHKYDVPYQSLMKIYLAENIHEEPRKASRGQ